jgi:hypothetical protein
MPDRMAAPAWSAVRRAGDTLPSWPSMIALQAGACANRCRTTSA